MKIEDIPQHLRIPPHITIGLARAGFFGLPSKFGRFEPQALRDFQKYGLQWDPQLVPRSVPAGLVPVVPGWENPPPHTKTEFSVAVEPAAEAGQDTHWLVNFFFRAHPFYFPADDTVQRLQPLPVKLKEKFEVSCGDASATVYPDPAGRLALIQVLGQGKPGADVLGCVTEARNCIVPVLNWLTMQTDHALPIVQQNWVGLPSGDIHFISPTKPAEVVLDPHGFTDHHPLREAQALYRLGLNCTEPSYAFLSFVRAYEAMEQGEPKRWLNTYGQKYAGVAPFGALYNEYKQARLPGHPVFGDHGGKKLNTAADELRDKYRNAIAHHLNGKDESMVLTGTDAASLGRMEAAIATMRYVVRTKLVALNTLFGAVEESGRNVQGAG